MSHDSHKDILSDPALQDVQEMFSSAPVGVFISTPEGRFISANQTIASMFGYDSPQEMIDSVTDIASQVYLDPSERDSFKCLMEQHGKVVNAEYCFRRRDGKQFWALVNARAFKDRKGRVVAYQGFYQDITERKEEENYIRQILDATNDGIWDYNLVSNEFRYSDRFAEMLGYKQGELDNFGCFCEQNLHPDDTRHFQEVFRDYVEGRSSGYEMKFRLKTREGDYKWIYTRGRALERDARGRALRVVGAHTDITEARQADAALRESEEKYRKLFDNAPVGIFQTSPDGQFISMNSEYAGIFGYDSPEEMMNQVTDIGNQLYVNPSERQRYRDALDEYGFVNNYEVLLKGRSGEGIWVSMNTRVNRGLNGEIIFDGFLTDISQRKQAEEEREKLQSQLLQAQKMESVGMLAGGVAHDFNNILHAISGNLEYLVRGRPLGHPDHKRLQTIKRSIDRAADLVQHLLLFSRKAGINKRALDLNREIKDSTRILERSIPRMIDIELFLDNGAWTVRADPIQVEQVLYNLGTNAADAMPQGGRLIIETANTVLGRDYVQTHPGAKPGQYVLMSVTDTGCGMDKETKKHIFEPFFTTKEPGRGTGLGLASVYGIVKAHDGYITCYSEPGRGTTISIYWPATPEIEVAEDETEVKVTSERGSETILVVDDEEEVRDLTAEALDDHGYRTLSAESGEQALKLYSDNTGFIDLVILDLNMPGMGGRRCLEKLLEIDPDAKVLIASGYSVNVQAGDIFSRGADGFLGKPYQVHHLLAKVRELLDQGKKTS